MAKDQAIMYSFLLFFATVSHRNANRVRFRLCNALLMLGIVFAPELSAQPSEWSGENISVERISAEHGLSSLSVNTIIQDKRGFIWIGTVDGLNKYDGENFTVYRNNPNDSTSVSHNLIWTLYEDRMGMLWVGTQNGLNKFDPTTNLFMRYFHDPQDSLTLSNNIIRAIYEDKVGTFWVGTAHGLNKFNKSSNTWTRIFPKPNDSLSTGNNFINVITEDSQNKIWFGLGHMNALGGGLSLLDRKSGGVTHFHHDDKNQFSLPNDWVTSLFEDHDGTLWIGTDGGVCTFNRMNNTFLPIQIASPKPLTIHRIFTKSICEDHDGNIWFATWGSGIFKYNREAKSIVQYTYDALNPLGITSPTVMTLFFDRSGLLWAGTYRGGVNTVATRPFVHHYTIANSLALNNGALSILEDHRGDLYIGTFLNGVWKYSFSKQALMHIPLPLRRDPMEAATIRSNKASTVERSDARHIDLLQEDKTGTIWFHDGNSRELIKYNPNSSTSLIVFRTPKMPTGFREFFNCFLLDSDGTVWVGSERKLYRIDTKGTVYSIFSSDQRNSKSLGPGSVNAILRDRSGTLWVGVSSGLHRFEEKSASFEKFQHIKNDSTSLSSNVVLNLLEDHRGNLWIGTEDGLNLFELATGRFTRFTSAEGMAGRTIVALQEDENGNIWVATEVGISQVKGNSRVITNYNQSSGLPTVEYFGNCSIRRKNGELLFGTNTGILAFNPDNVNRLEYVPPIIISGIKKFNRPIQLTTSPELLREIVFTYDENVFSISFSALSYEKYAFNQYAYKLDGFDKDWVYCGNRREAIYTNLDPGKYVFHVKGSNHDGVWNEQGTALSIIVLPPWYQEWWAYILYTVTLFGMLFSVYRVRINRLKLKQQVLVEHLKTEKLTEINSMKSRFLANVSHELRTPLTTIIGPVDQLSAIHGDKQSQEHLGMISRNAHRLLRMIDLLLQFSKAESGTLKLNVQKTAVISDLRRITSYFTSAAAKKEIQIQFTAPEEAIEGYLDVEKMEHILQNVITNAVKFTESGGIIAVNVSIERNELIIAVRDTGEGISQEHLPHIFDRFYRVDATHKKEGIGIGLSLTKELVEIHHGSISAQSMLGVGTTVVVKLPLAGYSEHEIGSHVIEEHKTKADQQILASSIPTSTHLPVDLDKTMILIAEDNDDTRSLIVSQLSHDYAVVESVNGRDALSKAQFQIPDLVISDVMMPDMDGYELCRSLKQDERTSHIPIILLTALADRDDKIEGLQTGADDYLIKPFDAKELSVRIRNLIENRKKMRETFSRSSVFPQLFPTGSSVDQQFINKAIATVHKHLSDELYETDQFSKDMFLSRAQLHRKLKALSDLSATEFIRRTRLHYAKELLEKNAGTIAEIADKVGFSNHSYFAKCFKEQFGHLPSEKG